MWKLKLDEQGKVVVQDGKPVYVDDAGKDVIYDVEDTRATIGRLNGEAKTNRERAETAEKISKPFVDAGITDPVAAKKAMDTVKALDSKDLVDAGKVEEVRQEAIKGVEEKYKPQVERLTKLEQQLKDEKIGGAFARSPLIVGEKKKVSIPADLVQARFGQHFTLEEDGSVSAKDASGNAIYSRANPGKAASFDEALEILIDQYPQKDTILIGGGQSGSGGQGGSGGNAGGPKTWTRAQFDAADGATRMEKSKGGFKVVD